MGIGVEVTLIVVAILLNGFFAASEFALVSARISRLSSLRAAGAAAAMRLKEYPETFLATVQIGITLVGTLASAVGGATAVDALTPVLVTLGLGRAASPLALGLVVVVLTYLSLDHHVNFADGVPDRAPAHAAGDRAPQLVLARGAGAQPHPAGGEHAGPSSRAGAGAAAARARGQARVSHRAGELLLAHADRALRELEAGVERVQELRGVVAGRVRLGTSASISIYLLPPALRRFRMRYPEVEIVIVTGNAAEITRAVVANDLDVGIVQPAGA